MRHISYTFIFLALATTGCTSKYSLLEDQNNLVPLGQISKITYSCEERINAGEYYDSDFCPKDKELTLPSDKYIDINIKRTLFSTDLSPAMPLFLGLIPSESTYEYLVKAKEINDDNILSEQEGTFYIVETWGSINTIQKIFGVSNDLETLENVLFTHIEDQIIMSHNKSLKHGTAQSAAP